MVERESKEQMPTLDEAPIILIQKKNILEENFGGCKEKTNHDVF